MLRFRPLQLVIVFALAIISSTSAITPPSVFSKMEGVFLPVVEAHVRYRSPARYDDLVTITAGPQSATVATVTFGYMLYRKEDGRLLAEGWTRHAAADRDGRVRRFPAELLDMLGFGTAVKGS